MLEIEREFPSQDNLWWYWPCFFPAELSIAQAKLADFCSDFFTLEGISPYNGTEFWLKSDHIIVLSCLERNVGF